MKYLSISEFAKRAGLSRQTVSTWVHHPEYRLRIPGLVELEDRHGKYWAIPESAVATLSDWRPTLGRPKGAKNKPKKKRR